MSSIRANYETLDRYGFLFGIPECCYIRKSRNITTEKKYSIDDTHIAYAISTSFYRIVVSDVENNVFVLLVTKLDEDIVYRTTEYLFTLERHEDKEGKILLRYREKTYSNWSDFINDLPFVNYIVPAPPDRYTRYLQYRRKEIQKEERIQKRKLKQAIKDYYCRN